MKPWFFVVSLFKISLLQPTSLFVSFFVRNNKLPYSNKLLIQFLLVSLHENCPNTELFLVQYHSVFSPNTGKYGPEITPYLDNFNAVYVSHGKKYELFGIFCCRIQEIIPINEKIDKE